MSEQLHDVVYDFVTHESLSSLIQTMNRLLNGFMESSDLDGTDKKLVTDTVEEVTRINNLFVQLYECSRS